MNIWESNNWKIVLTDWDTRRNGIRFRFDKDVDLNVKNELVIFGKWLRANYYFPIRIPIYVKSSERIKASDGDLVVGTFFEPFDYSVEPFIKIATGDFNDLTIERGLKMALIEPLLSLSHELTHYFQWINNIEFNEKKNERQAKYFAGKIISIYGYERGWWE